MGFALNSLNTKPVLVTWATRALLVHASLPVVKGNISAITTTRFLFVSSYQHLAGMEKNQSHCSFMNAAIKNKIK